MLVIDTALLDALDPCRAGQLQDANWLTSLTTVEET